MKKFFLTENEKKQIRKLYNLQEINADQLISDLIDKAKELGAEDEDSYDTSSSRSDSDYSTSTSIKPKNSNFSKITDKVIEKFEGGYWNPFCIKHPKEGMGVSTETMFGLDRYNGNIESTPEGKEFFKILDDEKYKLGAKSKGSGKDMKWKRMDDFCQKWTWGYNGGDKRDILKQLTIKIMNKHFDDNLRNFVKDSKTKEKIKTIPGLTLHMSYASWNGPGFFRDFAKTLQDGVASGKSDKDLINIAIKDRTSLGLNNQQKVVDEIKKLS